jgi:hypothetical protein
VETRDNARDKVEGEEMRKESQCDELEVFMSKWLRRGITKLGSRLAQCPSKCHRRVGSCRRLVTPCPSLSQLLGRLAAGRATATNLFCG